MHRPCCRCLGAEVPVLEQRAHDRTSQHEYAESGRQREQSDQADAERGLLDERAALVLAGDRSRHLRLEGRRDRHGQQTVRQHEERECREVGGRIARTRLGEIADEHRAPPGWRRRNPSVQADKASSLRTTGCLHFQIGRNRNPVRPAAITTMIAIAAMPPVAPSPSVQRRRLSVITSPSSQVLVAQCQQRGDDDEVRGDRAPRRCEELAAAVQERVRQSGQSVEQDLDQEDPRQQRADPAQQVGIDVRSRVEGVDPKDQRCGEHGDDRECHHQRRRDRDHDVGRLVVVGLDERREQWHQCCRQHSRRAAGRRRCSGVSLAIR